MSLCSGCKIGCLYCFTRNFEHFRSLTSFEIIEQAEVLLKRKGSHPGVFETKVSFKQMGDPLVNPVETLKAIEGLKNSFPDFSFVVSTSGPNCSNSFFKSLQLFSDCGVKIRLQFSCHTTSDQERHDLSSGVRMMNLEEVAEVVERWHGGLVTLNFVIMEGFEYQVVKIKRLFDPDKVFIKVNYLDPNSQTRRLGLKDAEMSFVKSFAKDLNANHFRWSFRQR